jgi:hypothetical protein
LSTLQRAADWPEVEKQISKVLSILVTYEDDWILLQRSAMIILTALYTLQVKTLTQCQSSARAAAQARNGGPGGGGSDGEGLPYWAEHDGPLRSRTASCASHVSGQQLSAMNVSQRWDAPSNRVTSAPMSPDSISTTRSARTDEAGPLSRGTSAGIATLTTRERSLDSEVEQLLHQQQRDQQSRLREKAEYLRKVQEEAEEEQESLKALISAAVAKLSLVLAFEWGKLASPLGGFGGPSQGGGGLGMGRGMGMGGES